MTPYKALHTIPDVLGRASDAWPEKDAYRLNGKSLTYSQLKAKSARLTTALRTEGVVKGDRVGIFLPQSFELPIAAYGVLGAGAAFVPIDPLAPKRRVAEILEQCGIRVVVTADRQAKILDELALDGGAVQVVIGARAERIKCVSWGQIDLLPVSTPVRTNELDIAYIMFTSGSTGTPKGIVHSHANGLIYADNLVRYHNLNSDDRFLNLSPLHFDMAVMDHVAALMVGATTIIVPEAVARLPASLTALAATERASIWYSVPHSMTEMLVKGEMHQHDLTSLRWMIYGGEAFAIRHLRSLMSALPNARFCNAYGPAETHQVSSFNIDELPEHNDYVIPIGEPWLTVDTLIVDEDDLPVAISELGELLVRAPSCMRGYWGDRDRSDAAFFYKSIDGVIQDRYYRTGDIVTMRPDGIMMFHGRKDRQVKVRGNRVELDEVEAILSGHASVVDCAVIKSPSGNELIAAVTILHDGNFDEASLRGYCRTCLPVYAVPSRIFEVTEFARTSSQKIDRVELSHSLKVMMSEVSKDPRNND